MKLVELTINEDLRKIRQDHIVESFLPLTNVTDDKLLNEFATVTTKLIKEGYNPDELDFIFEQSIIDRGIQGAKDAVQRGGLVDMGKQAWNKTDIPKTLLGSVTSTLKESIIRAILGYLGIKGTLVSDAITFFNDYDIRDVLKPFKSETDCSSYGPKMVDGIIEVILRHIIDKNTNSQLNPVSPENLKMGVRNLIAEAIRESNLGEVVSEKFCKGVIWKQ